MQCWHSWQHGHQDTSRCRVMSRALRKPLWDLVKSQKTTSQLTNLSVKNVVPFQNFKKKASLRLSTFLFFRVSIRSFSGGNVYKEMICCFWRFSWPLKCGKSTTDIKKVKLRTAPETNVAGTWKWGTPEKGDAYWKPSCLLSMLNFGDIKVVEFIHTAFGKWYWHWFHAFAVMEFLTEWLLYVHLLIL